MESKITIETEGWEENEIDEITEILGSKDEIIRRAEWREGTRGAFVMGLRHGIYCVGCCWMLMALLFATGVMNLLWVAVIATFVIAEKLMPRAKLVGRLSGPALSAIGLAVIFGTW